MVAPEQVTGPSAGSADRLREMIEGAADAAHRGEVRAAVERWTAVLGQLPWSDIRRVAALRHLGTAHREAGDPAQAEQRYRESLELATQLVDPEGLAHATERLALIALERGDLEAAAAGLEQADALAREAADGRLLGMVEADRGVLASVRGQLDAALVHYGAALESLRAAGDAEMVAILWSRSGLVAVELRRWPEAERCYAEALGTARAAGLQGLVDAIELDAGLLAARRAQWEIVADAGARGIERARSSGSRRREAQALRLRGIAAREHGRLADAEMDLSTGARLAAEVEDRLLEAQIARELGELYLMVGRTTDARASLVRAGELFERMGAAPDEQRTRAMVAELESAIGS